MRSSVGVAVKVGNDGRLALFLASDGVSVLLRVDMTLSFSQLSTDMSFYYAVNFQRASVRTASCFVTTL